MKVIYYIARGKQFSITKQLIFLVFDIFSLFSYPVEPIFIKKKIYITIPGESF
jgi:hypothetical protein